MKSLPGDSNLAAGLNPRDIDRAYDGYGGRYPVGDAEKHERELERAERRRADEIERESLEDYAARRKIQMSNPERKFIMARPRKTIEEYKAEVDDLKDQVSELEEENEALAGQLDEIQEILEPEEEEEEEEEEEDDQD